MYTSGNYFPVGGYPFQIKFFHPSLRVILCGVYDDKHALSVFGGLRYLVQSIWEFTGSYEIQYDAKIISKYYITSGFALRSPSGLPASKKRLEFYKICEVVFDFLNLCNFAF